MLSPPSIETVLARQRFARDRLARLKRDGGTELQLRQADRHVRYWTDQLVRLSKTPQAVPAEAPSPATEVEAETIGWAPPEAPERDVLRRRVG